MPFDRHASTVLVFLVIERLTHEKLDFLFFTACCICYERVKNTEIACPVKHVITCLTCTQQMEADAAVARRTMQCPFCRCDVTAYQHKPLEISKNTTELPLHDWISRQETLDFFCIFVFFCLFFFFLEGYPKQELKIDCTLEMWIGKLMKYTLFLIDPEVLKCEF